MDFSTPCKRWNNPNVNFNTPDSYYVGWSERTTGVNRSINEKNFWQPRKGYRAARWTEITTTINGQCNQSKHASFVARKETDSI